MISDPREYQGSTVMPLALNSVLSDNNIVILPIFSIVFGLFSCLLVSALLYILEALLINVVQLHVNLCHLTSFTPSRHWIIRYYHFSPSFLPSFLFLPSFFLSFTSTIALLLFYRIGAHLDTSTYVLLSLLQFYSCIQPSIWCHLPSAWSIFLYIFKILLLKNSYFFLWSDIFISPSFLKDIFARYTVPGFQLFSFSQWRPSCSPSLDFIVSA